MMGGTNALGAGHPELDPPAVRAGQDLQVQDAFSQFRPLAHQHPPAAAHAAHPKMFDADRLEWAATSKTGRLVRCRVGGHQSLSRYCAGQLPTMRSANQDDPRTPTASELPARTV